MKNERKITINIICNKKTNINRLVNFFAKKYSEKIVKE